MKKLFWLLAVAGLTLLSGLAATSAQSLGDIDISFCEGDPTGDGVKLSKSVNAVLEANQELPICLYVSNSSSQDAEVSIGFVDGTITQDSSRNKACLPEGSNQKFGQHVQFVDEGESKFRVPAGSSVVRRAVLQYPSDVVGDVLGCVTYMVGTASDDAEIGGGGGFKILTRKAMFVNTFVRGDLDIGLEFVAEESPAAMDKLSSEFLSLEPGAKKNEFELAFSLKNNGDIQQDVVLDVVVSNARGFEQRFSAEQVNILAGETANQRFTITGIPFYKGFYDVTVEAKHTPEFTHVEAPEELMEVSVLALTDSFFLVPREIIIALGAIVLLLIILAIVKRKKKSEN